MHAPSATERLTNRWLALGLLVMVAILNYADRFLMAGLAQPIKHHFGIGDAVLGALMGPAFALLYTVFTLPIARLADRRSRVAIIAGGCAVWSLFTVLSGMASSPAMLAIARIGVGVGEAAYQAPTAALIAAYFPVEQRGKAFALLGTAIYLGQIAGLAVAPAIGAVYGWRMAFYALGTVGVAVAAATFLIIREPARRTVAAAAAAAPLALGATVRMLLGTASIRHLGALLAFGTLSGVTFAMWGPALFERAYGLSNAEAGQTVALAFGLPGLVGMLGFGVLVDRLGRNDATMQLRLGALALASATTLILVISWVDNFHLARLLAVPAGLLGGGWSVAVMASLQYLLPAAHRATGTALVLLITGLFANVLGPLAAGQFSDWMAGDGAHGLRIGLSVALPTAYLGVWAALAAVRTLDRDRATLLAAEHARTRAE